MKKILIASPVRGGVSPTYVRNLIAILMANWDGRVQFNWAATTGTSVAWARDELVDTMLSMNYDGILFWDVDLGTDDPKMMVAAVARLFSHDVDIVGAAYVGHNVSSQFHGANVNQPVRDDGLMAMGQIPIGFSLIRTNVFKAIRKKFPWHEYIQKETGVKPPKKMFEYFPTGIVGPNTAQGKLERIVAEMKSDKPDEDLLVRIETIVNDNRYETNHVLGEDFYFCALARMAGFDLFIDNNMIIPHDSKVKLPIGMDELIFTLDESWRYKDNVSPEMVKDILSKLKEYAA